MFSKKQKEKGSLYFPTLRREKKANSNCFFFLFSEKEIKQKLILLRAV